MDRRTRYDDWGAELDEDELHEPASREQNERDRAPRHHGAPPPPREASQRG